MLAMAVGDGRFRGRNGVGNRRAVYGDRLGALCQLQVDPADGTSLTFGSAGSWEAGTGRIVVSDPKHGERADLRVPDDDWLTGAEAPPRFAPAEVLPRPRRLVAEETGRVRQVATLPAVAVTRTASGRQVVDLGQNVAGVVRIRLDGADQRVLLDVVVPPGATARVRLGDGSTEEVASGRHRFGWPGPR